tara:strand:- start:861 stop:2864 length:2004 start_codon:yes stop_codon:yes gene_type:complete
MADFKIKTQYSPKGGQEKAISELCNSINSGNRHSTLLGITGSGKTFTMANVIKDLNKPTLILSHNKTLAAQLYSEFKDLFPDNAVEFFISYYDYYQPEAYLPVTDTFIEKDSSIDEEIDRLRLKATASLASRKDVIIISSVSCIYGIGSPKNYSNAYVSINKNKDIDLRSMMKSLIDIHYLRNDMIIEPGTFRLLGQNFEIFPIYDDYPIRIELHDNSIEYMYRFDPLSGAEVKEINDIFIFPAKHFIIEKADLKKASDNIRDEMIQSVKSFKANNQLLEAQRIEQRTLFDLEMMMELGYCSGIENYSRHLDGRKKGERPYTLIDFFPDDFLMFIDESHVSIPQLRAMYNGDYSRKKNLVEHGFRLPSALDNRPMRFEEFEKAINQVVYVSATPSKYELEQTSGEIVEQIIRPTGLLDPQIEVAETKNQIDHLIVEIEKVVNRSERVLVTTLTKKMAEDLTDYLKKFNVKAEYLHSEVGTLERIKILNSLRKKDFDVLVGINLLREGLDLPEVSLVGVLDADKEGFLRSRTSLMQIAGRAARNVNGKVILYADRMTESIKYLIDETNRRIKVQREYNKKNNIQPETIKKSVEQNNLLTRLADSKSDENSKKITMESMKLDFDNLEKADMIKQLKKKMLKASNDLQFEEAAFLRDKIKEISGEENFII